MSLFGRLFGKKPAAERTLPTGGAPRNAPGSPRGDESVLIHLDGTGLPDRVYQECDLATLEDRLIEVLEREGLGRLDGNEAGPLETTLFLYGPDAEALFAGIEPVLVAYPLCRGARVVLGCGGAGTPEREIRLA